MRMTISRPTDIGIMALASATIFPATALVTLIVKLGFQAETYTVEQVTLYEREWSPSRTLTQVAGRAGPVFFSDFLNRKRPESYVVAPDQLRQLLVAVAARDVQEPCLISCHAGRWKRACGIRADGPQDQPWLFLWKLAEKVLSFFQAPSVSQQNLGENAVLGDAPVQVQPITPAADAPLANADRATTAAAVAAKPTFDHPTADGALIHHNISLGRMRNDIAKAPPSAAIATTVVSAAQKTADKARRREILPYIRTASDCVAHAIARDENRAAAIELLRRASPRSSGQENPVNQCQFRINDMIAAHDRIYGPGSGQAFYEGPYLKDLPRALTVRLRGAKGLERSRGIPFIYSDQQRGCSLVDRAPDCDPGAAD